MYIKHELYTLHDIFNKNMWIHLFKIYECFYNLLKYNF